MKAHLLLDVIENKKIITSHEQLSKSFLKQYIQLMYLFLSSDNSANIIDNAGSSQDIYGSWSSYPLLKCVDIGGTALNSSDVEHAETTADQRSIVLGLGTDPVSPTDYQLNTPIRHGNGTNQLIVFGSYLGITTITSQTAAFYIERMFRNDSGADITINEAGLFVGCEDQYQYSFCIIRDKLTSAVTVADGQYLRARYKISVTP